MKTPLVDKRNASDIFKACEALAKRYCPFWKREEKDPGSILLKIFSQLMEFLISRLNRILENYHLLFLECMGIEPRPPRCSRTYLSFYLAEKETQALVSATVPQYTRIAAQNDPNIVFETQQDVVVFDCQWQAAFSVWETYYADHSGAIQNAKEFSRFAVFPTDDKERKNRQAKTYLALPGNFEEGEAIQINAFSSLVKKKDDKTYAAIDKEAASYVVKIDPVVPDRVIVNDSPVDRTKGFYAFGPQPAKNDTLYIASDRILAKTGATIDLTITLREPITADPEKGINPTLEKKGINPTLEWEYWDGAQWKKLDGLVSANQNLTGAKEITIRFTCLEIPPTEIQGECNRWIRVWLQDGGYGKGPEFPTVDQAEALKTMDPAKAKEKMLALLTQALKELGEKKALEPATQAEIKKLLGNLEISETTLKHVTNLMERWNLSEVKDQILDLLTQNHIRLAGYKEATYAPPFLTSIRLGCTYESKSSNDSFLHYQDFAFYNQKPNGSLWTKPSFCLGCKKNISGQRLHLYLDLEGVAEAKKPNLEWKGWGEKGWVKLPSVQDGTDGFSHAGLVSLLLPAKMTPHRFAAPLEGVPDSFCEKDLYWIQIEITNQVVPQIVFRGIYPNSVEAWHGSTILDEVLGFGTGKPNLTLSFSQKPILAGEVVEVREPNVPSREECEILIRAENEKILEKDIPALSQEDLWKALKSKDGEDIVRIERNPQSDQEEVWVRWHRVENWATSHAKSRDYVLDYATGQIVFGDGEHGMIVPQGRNNIVAKKYRTGGGKKGNLPLRSLTMLESSLPGIDQVTNHVRCFGGNDEEDLEKMVARSPFSIQSQNRAIAKEDFESLACYASQDVCRAVCYVTRDIDKTKGAEKLTIHVPILAWGEEPQPQASPELVETVRKSLQEKTLITLKDNVQVEKPQYLPISVKIIIQVDLRRENEKFQIGKEIEEKTRQFLHPCFGREGQGWNFIQDTRESIQNQCVQPELMSFLAQIPGITGLTISFPSATPTTSAENSNSGERQNQEKKAYYMVCAGQINVT